MSTEMINPFPGLRPFSTEEDYLFFGREEQTNELLTLLREHRFIAVVGTSGSGKSSLVRAGLLPALHGGTMTQAGSSWEVVLLRPGGNPVANLARALLTAELYDPDDDESLPRIIATLNRSRMGLVEAVRQSDLPSGGNLLVVVDQFEELFRFRQSGVAGQEAAAAFVKLLLAASDQADYPIYVAITMRSDYLGECSQIPGLAEAVNNGEYLIPRLTREQRRAAIEKPAAVGGGVIAHRLVQKILNDVGDDPDQLPVMQHALMRMWDFWREEDSDGEPLDLVHYERAGGLHEALSRHADEVYEELGSDRLREVAERLFQALTERGPDNRGIRRPTRLESLCAITDAGEEEVTTVIDAFRRQGRTFLMPMADVELTPQTVIDISHESLMRVWRRLDGWVEEESQSARIYRRLAETAALYAEGKAGLFHDPDLQIAVSWRETAQLTEAWAARYHGGFSQAMAFLDASQEAEQAAERAREAARQRELEQARRLAEAERLRAEEQQRTAKRLKGLVGALAVAALLAVGAFLAAMSARNEAMSARIRAETLASQNADLAKDASEKAEFAEQESRRAIAEREEAQRQREIARQNGYVSQINTAQEFAESFTGTSRLNRLLGELRPQPDETDLRGWEWYFLNAPRQVRGQIIGGNGGLLYCIAANPRDDQLVFGGASQELLVWDRRLNRERLTLAGHELIVISVSWSPDGNRIASGSLDGTARIWDAATGLELHKLNVKARGATFVAWHPDGSTIATNGSEKVLLWDVETGRQVRELEGPPAGRCVFSSDGARLAAVNSSGFTVWNLDGNAPPKSFGADDTLFLTAPIAWSPDGTRIVIGDRNTGNATIWNVESGQTVGEPLSGHENTVFGIAWSPDGSSIATASFDGTARVFDVQTGRSTRTFRGHSGRLYDVAWLPDGRSIATVATDGRAIVWKLDDQNEADVLVAHPRAIDALSWSPDSSRFVSCAGQSLIVWDALSHEKLLELSGQENPAVSVVWSSHGNWIAAGDDKRIHIWDANDGALLRDLSDDTLPINELAWSPADNRLAALAGSNKVLIWDLSNLDEPSSEVLNAPNNSWYFTSIGWSPDGRQLATVQNVGNSDSSDEKPPQIGIWNVDTRELVKGLSGESEWIAGLAWSPDGRHLASFGYKSSVGALEPNLRIWDVESGGQTAVIRDHTRLITAVQWSPDGLGETSDGNLRDARLATSSEDGAIRVWHAGSGRELLKFAGDGYPVNRIAWSPDGVQIVSGDTKGRLQFFDARQGYQRELAKTLLRGFDQRIDSGRDTAADLRLRAAIHARGGQWDLAEKDLEASAEKADGNAESWFLAPWWLLGPFPTDHQWDAAASDPFAELPQMAAAADEEVLDVRWQPVFPRDDGGLNLREYFDATDNQSCYVYTRIHSPKMQSAGLLIGSDDTHRIWLNGQVVHENKVARAAARDQNAVLVTLEAGWNTVVAQIDNLAGEFEIYLRLSNDPFDLAKAFERSAEWDAALTQWDRACETDPNNVSLRIRNAEASRKAEKLERAAERYAAAVEMVPGSAVLIRRRAALLQELGRGAEAVAEYRRLIDFKPDDWELRFEVGRLYAQLLGRPDHGSPDGLEHPAELFGRSLGFADLGLMELAEADVKAGIELAEKDPGSFEGISDTIRRQADSYANQGKIADSIDLLSLLLRVEPDSYELVFERGQLYGRSGKWEEAAADLVRAIELDSADQSPPVDHTSGMPGPRFRLAPLLVELGQLDRYREHCLAYLEAFKEASNVEAGRALQACLWMPDTLPDWDAFQELAERTHTGGRRLAPKGMYYYRAGRNKDAIELIPQGFSPQFPGEQARAQFVLAMAYHREGQNDEAAKTLQEAENLLEQTMSNLQSAGDLGTAWHDWVAARILRREAVGLIRGPVARYRLEASDLIAESRLDEAEERLDQGLAQSPEDPQMRNDRALLLGHRKRWAEALDDLRFLIRHEPDDTMHWLRAAPLFVVTNDIEGYGEHCRAMLERFGGDDRGYVLERTAKSCLLLPDALDNMQPVFSLAEKAVLFDPTANYMPYFNTARALARYRAGQFESAVRIAEQNSSDAERFTYLPELNRVVLSLAHFGAGKPAETRRLLQSAAAKIDASLVTVDLSNWHDVLINDILRQEAEKLLAGANSGRPESGARKDQ